MIIGFLDEKGGVGKTDSLSAIKMEHWLSKLFLNPCSPKFTLSPQAWPLIF